MKPPINIHTNGTAARKTIIKFCSNGLVRSFASAEKDSAGLVGVFEKLLFIYNIYNAYI